MRQIQTSEIVKRVRDLCIEANTFLGEDVIKALKEAHQREESPTGKEILSQIIENAEIARKEGVPMCQDTGFAVFFVEVGRDVRIEGGPLEDAINEGVRQGYREGYLRKSICDPLSRENTGDNTPAIIHTRLVEGENIRIIFAPKGAGSENMSRLSMLKPADGVEGIKAFVLETVERAGANPCPPIIVGVGVGGTFERCALLAKEALLRDVGTKNRDPRWASLEEELLEEVNRLGIGPMGLGGRTTALAVHIESHPCHIASLPVAVNIQCHAARHKEVVL